MWKGLLGKARCCRGRSLWDGERSAQGEKGAGNMQGNVVESGMNHRHGAFFSCAIG